MTSTLIAYTTKGIVYESAAGICIEAITSKKNIKKIKIQYDSYDIVLQKNMLAPCYYAVVNYEGINNSHLWDKINHLSTEDNFLYGFISYITFFALIEQTKFMDLLPFTFLIPCSLANGDCCDSSIMNYLVVPMESLLYNVPKLQYHFIHSIIQFIKNYANLFHAGPTITDEFMEKYTTESLGIDCSQVDDSQREVCSCTECNQIPCSCTECNEIDCSCTECNQTPCSCTECQEIDNAWDYLSDETPMLDSMVAQAYYDNYDTVKYDQLTFETISEQPIITLRFA